jgi:hypothetical protein
MIYEHNFKNIVNDLGKFFLVTIIDGNCAGSLDGDPKEELKTVYDYIQKNNFNKIAKKEKALEYFSRTTRIVSLHNERNKGEIEIHLTSVQPAKEKGGVGFYRVGLIFYISLRDFSFDVKVG